MPFSAAWRQAIRACNQTYAHIAQYGGVGEVALPARNGQLIWQVLHHGIGQTEVAFGVSKSMGLTLCGMVEEPTSPCNGALV